MSFALELDSTSIISSSGNEIYYMIIVSKKKIRHVNVSLKSCVPASFKLKFKV